MEGFDFELTNETRRAIEDAGYEQPTPIQALTIAPMLSGQDLIGQAQTGTGKTAAFGIPIVERVDATDPRTQALVLCPTRELAVQTAGEIQKLGRYRPGLRVLALYGGQPIERQLRELKYGAQVVVGTPGRVMDHLNRGSVDISGISICILDEADEMLDMGFRDDIESILSKTSDERQTALFSATMPLPIMSLAQKYLREPMLLRVENQTMTVEKIKQSYIQVRPFHKNELLARLLVRDNITRALVFMNTRAGVEDVVTNLQSRGFAAAGLHGDMRQMERDAIMARFKGGLVQILIATDVAARGLDISDVEAVFNYDVPLDVEQYVHRIGRTGRAGKEGRAYTFVTGREMLRIWDYRRLTKALITVEQPPTGQDIHEAQRQRLVASALALAADEQLETDPAAQELLNGASPERALSALLKLLYDAGGKSIQPELDIRVPEPPKPKPQPRFAPAQAESRAPRRGTAGKRPFVFGREGDRREGDRRERPSFERGPRGEKEPQWGRHQGNNAPYGGKRMEKREQPAGRRGFYDPRRGPKPDKQAQGRAARPRRRTEEQDS